MQSSYSDIQQLARAHHYSIHPFALRRLEKFLAESCGDTSGRRKLLSDLFTRIREQGVQERIIDEANVCTAIQSLNSRLQHTSEKDGVAAVQVIHIHQTPNIGVNEVTEELVTLPANYRTDRLGAFRQRYLLALRRCQRSGIFALSSKTVTNDAQILPLLAVSSLEGRPSTDRVAVLGMLVEHKDGIHIEDMHAHAMVDTHPSILGEYTQGFIGSGFLVVVTGVWRGDKLHAQKLTLPPAELRERTVRDYGSGDLFGLAPTDLAFAQQARANALHSVIIFLAHVHLDRATTLTQLGSFFTSMQNRSEREHASTTYCFIGNFSSLPLSYGDASHLPDSFTPSSSSNSSSGGAGGGASSSNSTNTDCLRALLDRLGRCIAASAPSAAQLSHFILIPGPHDASSVQGTFPQPPFTTFFAKGLMSSVKTLSLAPNPCRLRFYNHEVVVSRRDYLRTFRTSEGKLMQCLSSDSTTSTSTPAHAWEPGSSTANLSASSSSSSNVNRSDSAAVAELPTTFERITKTVVDEAHLAPDSETPILWKSDKALRLPSLPHTLLLCDSTEQWECIYKGVRVVNPGSFAVSTTFLWYTPADGECSLCSLE